MKNKGASGEPAEYKFLPPPGRADAIVRFAIIQRLLGVGSPPIAVLQGPAGSGKSTTLQQVHEELCGQKWTTAWLVLDNADNDPQRFEAQLQTMLMRVQHVKTSELLPRRASDRLTEWVLAVLGNIPGMVALFFDDFHTVHDPVVLQLFRDLLPRLPGRARIFIGSRSLPEIGLASLLVARRATVLRAEELRFSTAESQAFFTQDSGLAMKDDEVERIHQRTEGWPAGLQLFRLTLANPTVRHSLDDLAAHGPRELTEYLSENAVSMQRPEVQEFLLRTSMLRRLTGPLCDAMTGNSGSSEILRQLEHDGLFLSALDASGTWFRYHGLFAAYLCDSLKNTEPRAVRKLHRIAAHWHLEHGDLEEAVYHATEAEDTALAVRAMNPWVTRLISTAELATAAHWYDRVGLDGITQHPDLMIKIAWALIFLRSSARLRPLVTTLAQQAEPGHIVQTTHPGVVLSMAAVFKDDLPGGVALLVDLPELYDPKVSGFAAFELGAAANLRAFHALGCGDIDTAHRMLLLAQSHNERSGAAFSEGYTTAVDGMGRVLAAQPRQAFRSLSAAAARGGRLEGAMASAARAASQIWAAYEVNALEEVEQLADRFGAQIARGAVPDFIATAMVSVARTHMARRRIEEVQATLDAMERIAFDSGWDRLVGMVEWERARFAWLEGDLTRARSIVRRIAPSAASTVDWLAMPELLGGQLLGRIRLALYEGDAKAAAQRLTALEPLCAERPLLQVKCQGLKALLLDLQGHTAAAQRSLVKALELAAHGECVRAFIDEGPRMYQLLEHSINVLTAAGAGEPAEPTNVFACHVLRAAGLAPGEQTALLDAQDSNEPLSKRERRVLHLLSEGASNRDLAEQLAVSQNTVKFHLKNLYAKLGVGSRSQAIRAALNMQKK